MIRGWITLNGGEKATFRITEPYEYWLTITNNGEVAYSEIRRYPNGVTDYIWYRSANEWEINLAKKLNSVK